ncbi:MAG: hypothetical protein ACRD2W_16600 [Acidimicrobiales bacterium]
MRVHLAPYGTKDDLVRTLHEASDHAEGLLRQAAVIATEFLEGRHQFQDQVHVRSMLFDYLWNHGLVTYLWAERSLERVASWPGPDLGLEPDAEAVEGALAVIAGALAGLPPSLHPGPS